MCIFYTRDFSGGSGRFVHGERDGISVNTGKGKLKGGGGVSVADIFGLLSEFESVGVGRHSSRPTCFDCSAR